MLVLKVNKYFKIIENGEGEGLKYGLIIIAHLTIYKQKNLLLHYCLVWFVKKSNFRLKFNFFCL